MIFLDANATEPVRPEARAAILAAIDLTGNPASVHAPGRAARAVLESARRAAAARFGVPEAGVVFTSGGTEACALGMAGLGAGRRLLVGATEHDAVRAASPDAVILPVHASGELALDALEQALRGGGPALVCLMLANNETGVIHPVAEAAALCRAHGARLFVDAVQAAGRLPCDLGALGADGMAVSSHKLGGGMGAGALLLAPGRDVSPLLAGGGQERGRRGGTPALPAIAGFGAALAIPPDAAGLAPWRDAIERDCVAQGGVVCGGGARLANTLCIARPGMAAAVQLIRLDLAGIAVSAGSACSSGRLAQSHVLQAMGLGELAGQAIRISLPWNAEPDCVTAFAKAY